MSMTELDFTELLQSEPLPTTRESRTSHLAATAATRGQRQRKRRTAVMTAIPLTLAIGVGSLALSSTGALHHAHAHPVTLIAVAAHPNDMPANPWRDSPYWYVSEQTTQTMEGPAGMTYTDISSGQEWLGHDTASRYLTQQSDNGGTATDATTTGAPFSAQLSDGTQLSWAQLYALPTDPHALRAYLLQHISRPAAEVDLNQWRQLTRLLSDTPASPALRDALHHVATSLPEVTATTGELDSRGRAARTLTYTYPQSGGALSRLFQDPDTGRVLQYDEYAGTPGAGPPSDQVPAGTLSDRTVYTSGPATSDHETPAAAD